jgi:hypothetical protein
MKATARQQILQTWHEIAGWCDYRNPAQTCACGDQFDPYGV